MTFGPNIEHPSLAEQSAGNVRRCWEKENFADRGSSYIYAPSLRSKAERKTYR
jgi:hypothetical protein